MGLGWQLWLSLVHSHSIYVLGPGQELDEWRQEIFDRILRHLSEGYAVVYVGDESENAIIRDLLGRRMPVDGYLEKGLLTFIARDVFYSPFVPSKVLLEQWAKLFASIEKKAGRGNLTGFVAMGMPADSFFLSELDNRQLVRYESLASKQYKGDLEAMCIYTTPKIEQMPLRHIISLLNAHQNTGHKNGTLREWNSNRGLQLIKGGLDSALGPNVADLVLPIIVRDFEMAEDALINHPDQFERKLDLLLGPTGSAIALDHLKKAFCEDIAY
jgi:hypothetical protein